jgi:hypothetical protein
VFDNDVPGRFTSGYGARPDQIAPFFEGLGLQPLAVVSSEGITIGMQTVLPDLLADEAFFEQVLPTIVRTASDPSILGLANHLLYVGQKPPGGHKTQ